MTTKKKAKASRATAAKVAPKKQAPKKQAPKKQAPKKQAPKKQAPKKQAPKKQAPKKQAPKKQAPKKQAPKKQAPKKQAPVTTSPVRPAEAARAVEALAAQVRILGEEAEARKARLKKAPKLPRQVLNEFRGILQQKRMRILNKARSTIEEGMKFDEADLPDEYDQATSEYLQYFTLRLRGREKYFLDKIEQALARIEDGSFGICEACGNEIGINRLYARPETTLCIRCKEAQEREERQFGD